MTKEGEKQEPDVAAATTAAAAAAAAQANQRQLELLLEGLSTSLKEVKRNNLEDLAGIRLFAGKVIEGHTKPSSDSSLTYDLSDWLVSINQRTSVGFDDVGRIKAAEKFSTGTGRSAVQSVLWKLQDNLNWDSFQTELKALFGTKQDVREYRTKLHSSVLHHGESFLDFYIRLSDLANRWISRERDHQDEAHRLVVDAMMRALPQVFKYRLADGDYDKPTEVLRKALMYLEGHPQAKLNYGRREPEALVNAAVARRDHCYRCGGNHSFVECPRQLLQCGKCNRRGHRESECGVKCFNCGNLGHLARNCRSGPRPLQARPPSADRWANARDSSRPNSYAAAAAAPPRRREAQSSDSRGAGRFDARRTQSAQPTMGRGNSNGRFDSGAPGLRNGGNRSNTGNSASAGQRNVRFLASRNSTPSADFRPRGIHRR